MRAIDADAVYELHGNYPSFARSSADLTDLRDILDDTPTLDDLRPKGRWNIVEIDKATNRITIECSACGMVEETSLTAYGLNRDFRPSCGADMRGGGEDA